MSQGFARIRVFVVAVFLACLSVVAVGQSATNEPVKRSLRASEVMAIQAGGALAENIAHDITTRGINFHPDENFLALMTKAGADARVLTALKTATVSGDAAKPDMEFSWETEHGRDSDERQKV
jgi:hypothetical protein